jgi:hypothetical protein
MGGDGMTTQLVQIDASDFDHAAAALAQANFEDLAAETVKHTLRLAANVVRGNVRSRARRHHRTGELEAGVHTSWRGAGLGFMLRVRTDAPISNLIVGGVRPHVIRSTRPMPVGGLRGFAEAVHHPGFRADPFFHEGIVDSLPAIQQLVDAAAKSMADQLATAMETP